MWPLIYIIAGIASTGLLGLVLICTKMELELKAVDKYIKTLEVSE